MSEEKRLKIIAEISIFPVGEGTSLSPYVKRAFEAICSVEGLRLQLTPMGTIVEAADLEQILEAFKRAHKAVREAGARRIVEHLRLCKSLGCFGGTIWLKGVGIGVSSC